MKFVYIDIILISPGWTTYAPQVKLSGKSPTAIIQTSAGTDWKLTPKTLESTLQSLSSSSNKLIIFNNPGNPCKRFNIILISVKLQYKRSIYTDNI